MNIEQFAKKPELIKIILDSDEIKSEYGDEVIFWMKEFVDINTYFDFYRTQTQTDNSGELGNILQKIILNEQGQPAIKEGHELPAGLAIAALGKINDILGKSETKPLTKEAGTQPA